MTIRKRAVSVMQLPELKSAKQRQNFLRDMQGCIDAERPLVVLDCSSVGELDGPKMYLLLCCLEEAMKRNGDVKLAGLNASAETALKNFGTNCLFDLHDTTAAAVSSFHQPFTGQSSKTSRSSDSRTQPGSAA